MSVARLEDGLAGVRASALAASVARAELYDYATGARATGSTWADIAEALGVDDEHGVPAELAYELIVEGRAVPRRRSLWQPTARWTCGSCGESVVDHGPYDGCAVNNESGHEDHCPRIEGSS
ncbi:hypothetical protein [Pseudonocardia ailaonensis]|uniref:hypothetical protein n=1 Tax=Pseudonocardia ailaonensis TaxID=367279 RepID=UPI0031E07EE1